MSATAMVPSVPSALSERLRSVTTVFSLERKEKREEERGKREEKWEGRRRTFKVNLKLGLAIAVCIQSRWAPVPLFPLLLCCDG